MRSWIFAALLLWALPAAADPAKFALAVYHFNIQYVEGGLIGFPDGVQMNATFNMNDAQVQDQLVTQSFEPLLDLYLRHPTWGADIELQGYMLDVIVERHPSTFAKMKTLAAAGQVSFDSFHWSDQFWLAYPRVDMERSHDLTVQSFQNAGVTLGTSIFTQEGQFAIGMERFFRERGIKTAIVQNGILDYTFPSTAYTHSALYTLGSQPDVTAVITGGFQDDKVEVTWDFVDDGEKAVTNGLDPYVGTAFVYRPDATATYEQQLESEETNGFQHVSVASYVQQALALGEQPTPLPEVVDDVWTHHNIFLWMGGTSLEDALLPGTSDDNGCHTLAMQAHRKILAAEQGAQQLKTHTYDARITQAWKDLLLGEGSDGTGQNPWIGERKYSQQHSQAALDAANKIISDAHMETVAPSTKLVDDPGPFQLVIDPAARRQPHVKWQKHADVANTWDVTVSFDAVPDDPNDADRHKVSIDFPRTVDDLIWCGALEEQTLRDVPLANIVGVQIPDASGGMENVVFVPAANGLVGLGNETYVIKQTETVHVAALLPGPEKVVRFRNDTAPLTAITWKFTVMQSATPEAAMAQAQSINVDPPALKESLKVTKPCGCQSSPTGAVVMLVALSSLVMRRRRESRDAV